MRFKTKTMKSLYYLPPTLPDLYFRQNFVSSESCAFGMFLNSTTMQLQLLLCDTNTNSMTSE